VNFEWDPAEATRNRWKHRVTLEESVSGFGDPLALTYSDPGHSVSEMRFITVGVASAGRVLVIAHKDRNENFRIISAREATRRERNDYEEEV
jgi:uncharacterized DUF497 family protein